MFYKIGNIPYYLSRLNKPLDYLGIHKKTIDYHCIFLSLKCSYTLKKRLLYISIITGYTVITGIHGSIVTVYTITVINSVSVLIILTLPLLMSLFSRLYRHQHCCCLCRNVVSSCVGLISRIGMRTATLLLSSWIRGIGTGTLSLSAWACSPPLLRSELVDRSPRMSETVF